jgi:hypothetical protein
MLTAELLTCFILVGIRVVADFEVSEGGEVKGNVLHPSGQLGPLAILAGLIGSFFILSFLAAAGGTKAKLAVIFGGIITLGLGIKSLAEIEFVAGTIGKIGTVVVPPPSGTPEGVLGSAAGAGADAAQPGAAATAGTAASKSAQAITGSQGITYVAPTSLNAIAHDLGSAAQQSLRQLIPGGNSSLVQELQSKIGDFYKSILGGL